MHAPFLSSPAAKPTGLGKDSPITVRGVQATGFDMANANKPLRAERARP